MDINSLYESAVKGDKASEEKLFKALFVRFRLFALQRVWNEDDSNDVVQNAMLVIAREYKNTEIRTSFSAWAYKVLDNRILGYIKSKKSQKGRSEPISAAELKTSGAEADPTLPTRLKECIKKVAGTQLRYARILNLHYQGFSTTEVCEKLGITPNLSYVTLSRARSLLESCLEKGVV